MPDMPEGTKAFIVLKDGVVVNKIVPPDVAAGYADILSVYSDPSYEVKFYPSADDLEFTNTNAPVQGE